MNKQELLQITAEQVGRMSEEELRTILSNIYQCIDQDLLDKALQDTKENIIKEVLKYTHEMGQDLKTEDLNAMTQDELFPILKESRAFHSKKKLDKEFEQLKSKEALLSRVSFALKWYAEKQKPQEYHKADNGLKHELLSMLSKPTNNHEEKLYSMLKTSIEQFGWQFEFCNKGTKEETAEENVEIDSTDDESFKLLCFSDKPIDLTLFTGEWNVERLFESLLEIINMKGEITGLIDDMLFRVKAQRVAAVFSAFGKKVIIKTDGKYIRYEINNIINDDCSEDKVKEMCNIIGYEYIESEDEYLESYKESIYKLKAEYQINTLRYLRKYRETLFEELLNYRLQCRHVINHWKGCIEGALGGMLIGITGKLISSNLTKDVKQLDRLLILMLGDGYDKSFSERELITNFNYPAITDSELKHLEWEEYL